MNRPRIRTLNGPHEKAALIGAKKNGDGSEGRQVLLTRVIGPQAKGFFRFLSRYNQTTAWVVGTRKWSILLLRDDDPQDYDQESLL